MWTVAVRTGRFCAGFSQDPCSGRTPGGRGWRWWARTSCCEVVRGAGGRSTVGVQGWSPLRRRRLLPRSGPGGRPTLAVGADAAEPGHPGAPGVGRLPVAAPAFGAAFAGRPYQARRPSFFAVRALSRHLARFRRRRRSPPGIVRGGALWAAPAFSSNHYCRAPSVSVRAEACVGGVPPISRKPSPHHPRPVPNPACGKAGHLWKTRLSLALTPPSPRVSTEFLQHHVSGGVGIPPPLRHVLGQ